MLPSSDLTPANYTYQKPPPLPVPPLRQTLDAYLEGLGVIVNDEKVEKTKRWVEEFMNGDGPRLQQKLETKCSTQENWINDWWLDDMYLKVRHPLPVHSNPGMIISRENFTSIEDLISFAAKLVANLVDIKTSILDKRELPQDTIGSKAAPLCMEQHQRLFNVYRAPCVNVDEHLLAMPSRSGHIIVAYKGQFYSLTVVAGSEPVAESVIQDQIAYIVRSIDQGDVVPQPQVGVATSWHRDSWARLRVEMVQSQVNADSLKKIETSFFILCIDEGCGDKAEDEAGRIAQMLHGWGTNHNGNNRWYDKTLQFIISKDGDFGLNYEHSCAEGIAVINVVEKVLHRIRDSKATPSIGSSLIIPKLPSKLRFHLTRDHQTRLCTAASALDDLVADLDLAVLRFTDFGKDFIKNNRMSPDAFFQLALQMAYFDCHNHLVATYESATLRRFHLGRVDVIRAATPEAKVFVRAANEDSENHHLLLQAVEKQTSLTKKVVDGNGIDNHLLGLRMASEDEGLTLPIFTDPSFTTFHHFSLSTSQVPTSDENSFMCYGAVTPDGYGAAYNPKPNSFLCVVASFKSNPATSSHRFISLLTKSLKMMHKLVDNNTDDMDGQVIKKTQVESDSGSETTTTTTTTTTTALKDLGCSISRAFDISCRRFGFLTSKSMDS